MNALAQVRDIFARAGFRAQRPRLTEANLRVYVDKNNRPLLNPRLYRAVRSGTRAPEAGILRVDVWTDGSSVARQKLREFSSDTQCHLSAETTEHAFGTHEGHWDIPVPVSLDGELRNESSATIESAVRRIWFALVPSAAP